MALQMSIKVANMSNVMRPPHLAIQWAETIQQAFYHQGDMEKELGLPITPFMNREEPKKVPQGQIAFNNYIATPLYETWTDFLPEMAFFEKHKAATKSYWEEQMASM